MEYKYHLDKSSKKHPCPGCGKRTFVRFVDSESRGYVDNENCGRCDRESKCGYFQSPKGEGVLYAPIEYKERPKPSYHDYKNVSDSGRLFKQNNFIQFLLTVFTKDEVKKVILQYLIGTSKYWPGACVFWQIDEKENVRAGKILLYDKTTGKRRKTAEGKALINWAHKAIKSEGFNLSQCLFGLHLINENTDKSICLVESEKTAVMLSILKPEYIWLATGSKHGFKEEYLWVIKDRKIVAFPDKSEYNDWDAKSKVFNNDGYNITVSSWLENTGYPDGTDLADVLLIEKTTESEVVTMPVIEHPSATEVIAQAMAKINPAIRLLIDAFDLTDNTGKEIRQLG